MSDNSIVVFAEDREPDLSGPHGKAWKVDVEAVARRYPGSAPAELTPCAWIVEARWAHPIWHSYGLACISLRTHPGWQPAVIRMQGATHELFLYALNPDQHRALNDRPAMLSPLNFGAQFIADSDEAARQRIEETVRDIIEGRLNPDTDARRQWIARFGDNSIKPEWRDMPAGDAIIAQGDSVTVIGTGAAVTRILGEAAKPDPKDVH